MSLTIRGATAADSECVADVLLQSRNTFLPYAPFAHSEFEVRKWVARDLIPSGTVMVAEESGEIIGMVATSQNDGGSWIEQLYVKPAHVNRGIGSRLLQFAHCVLARPIRLYTFQENVKALRFYETHGYAVIKLSDGKSNEEHCPDVLLEFGTDSAA